MVYGVVALFYIGKDYWQKGPSSACWHQPLLLNSARATNEPMEFEWRLPAGPFFLFFARRIQYHWSCEQSPPLDPILKNLILGTFKLDGLGGSFKIYFFRSPIFEKWTWNDPAELLTRYGLSARSPPKNMGGFSNFHVHKARMKTHTHVFCFFGAAMVTHFTPSKRPWPLSKK